MINQGQMKVFAHIDVEKFKKALAMSDVRRILIPVFFNRIVNGHFVHSLLDAYSFWAERAEGYKYPDSQVSQKAHKKGYIPSMEAEYAASSRDSRLEKIIKTMKVANAFCEATWGMKFITYSLDESCIDELMALMPYVREMC